MDAINWSNWIDLVRLLRCKLGSDRDERNPSEEFIVIEKKKQGARKASKARTERPFMQNLLAHLDLIVPPRR